MIAFLKGIVEGKTPLLAYINVNGVGYEVFMSTFDLAKCQTGDEVRVLTYMHVTENGVALYGFLESEAKWVFEKLISVSGVGPKVALAALSVLSPSDIGAAVIRRDDEMISGVPGIPGIHGRRRDSRF